MKHILKDAHANMALNPVSLVINMPICEVADEVGPLPKLPDVGALRV